MAAGAVAAQRRIEEWSPRFAEGASPKHWTNHPLRSLKKKVGRSCGGADQYK